MISVDREGTVLKNISIYIATQSTVPTILDSGYRMIQVGRANSDVVLECGGDDSGDNISSKNAYFCELTALYWMWKNDVSEYVGLVHYRRFFRAKHEAIFLRDTAIASSPDLISELDRANIIIPSPQNFFERGSERHQSVEQHYFTNHHGHDLFLTRQAIKMRCQNYLEAFDFVLRNNQLIPFNMFVARRAIMMHYCEWLFPLLFSIEEGIPYLNYDSYQSRVFGFLSERLFNVWLAHNREKIRPSIRQVVVFEK